MKKIKKILLVPILAMMMMMSFSQCSSAQFDEKAPITITEIFYQEWVGGRPGSKGTLVTIKGKNPETAIIFDSIYFNKKVVKLESYINKNELTLTGNFIITTTKPNDLIMHSDPKKEFGNKAPEIIQKTPFEIKENEVVISYFIKAKKRYSKLTNIKKIKTLFYQ